MIELLVVIAIIALLISILLPALESARRQSKASACLSHVKNIATSSRVYEADDASGWGIPVHPRQFGQDRDDPTYVGAYEWGGKSGIGRTGFADGPASGPYAWATSKYGTKAGFGPATRPLNDILYPGGFKDNLKPYFERDGAFADTMLELDLFKCPGDDGPPRGGHCPDWINSERSSYDHYGNSYAANVFFVASVGGGCLQSNSPYMRPVSRVPTPSRTLYYEENIGRWAWSAREIQCDRGSSVGAVDPGPTKTIRGWHGQDWTYNRAFVDAHAERQKIWLEGTENSEGYANHYVVEHLSSYPSWFPECNNNGFNGDYEIFRCVIIRGPGWQKDTLPASLILTDLLHPAGGLASQEGCVGESAPQ